MSECPADKEELRKKLFEITEALKKEGVDVEISDDNQTMLNNITRSFCSKAGEEQFKNNIADLPRKLDEYHSRLYGFEERSYYRWSEPFSLFEYFILQSQDINGEFYNKFGQLATEEKDLVFGVLLRLHAKACIVAKEILTLMRSGYPDGASARCRTLNEFVVISFFIAKHGNDVAERYMDHQIIETYKAANEFQKYCEKMGEIPFSNEEMEILHQKRENLIELHKKPFKERYGWAADALNNPNPNFTDIMRDVEFSHLLPTYRMTSWAIHANSKCMMFKLASPDEKFILTGESNIGMADPGCNATISLWHMNYALFKLKENIENKIRIQSMTLLVNEITKAFIDVHNSINLDEVSIL